MHTQVFDSAGTGATPHAAYGDDTMLGGAGKDTTDVGGQNDLLFGGGGPK